MNLKQSFEQRLKRQGISTVKEKALTAEYYFKQFRDCKFWIWDRAAHEREFDRTNGKCCYNHLIGFPRKQGKPFGLFDYQKRVIDCPEAVQASSGIQSKGVRHNRVKTEIHGLVSFKG